MKNNYKYEVVTLEMVGKYRMGYCRVCLVDDYKIAKNIYNQLVEQNKPVAIRPVEQ